MDFNSIITFQTISIYPFSYVSPRMDYSALFLLLTPPRTRKRNWLSPISLLPPIPSVPDVSLLALRNILAIFRYSKGLRMRSKPHRLHKPTDVNKTLCVLSFFFLPHPRSSNNDFIRTLVENVSCRIALQKISPIGPLRALLGHQEALGRSGFVTAAAEPALASFSIDFPL